MPTPPPEHDDHAIIIRRRFEAPRELVWEMFMDPLHVARWWGPKGFTTRVERLEPWVGGQTRYIMVAPNGMEIPVEGRFLEFDPPCRFVSTDGFGEDYDGPTIEGSKVTLTLERDGLATEMTLRISHPSAEEKAKHEELGVVGGWNSTFDCLEEALAEVGGAEAADRDIVLIRSLNAPIDLVWSAWTEPAQLASWWGPEGFSTTTKAMALEPGGRWEFTMHGPDGRDYPNLVEFLAIQPKRRLSYKHVGDSEEFEDVAFQTTVTFTALGERTQVRMVMSFATAEAKEQVIAKYGAFEGGIEHLGRLAEHVCAASGGDASGLTVAWRSATRTVLRRRLAAPHELVFEAFTRPEHIRSWWGPARYRLTTCELDARPGGAWRFVQESEEGDVHAFHGELRELEPPHRIVQTFVYEGQPEVTSVETMTFEADGEATLLRAEVEHPPTGACARCPGMEAGAAESYERLEALTRELAAAT